MDPAPEFKTQQRIGKEFTPTANNPDAVQIALLNSETDRSTAMIRLRIRDARLNGPILGQVDRVISTVDTTSDTHEVYRFEFGVAVTLTSESTYVLEVETIAGKAA